MLRRRPEPLAVPVSPPEPAGPLEVALVSPVGQRAGAERWMLDLQRAVDPARLHWRGVAIVEPNGVSPEFRAEVEQICPLTVGPKAVTKLAKVVDVLIVWGVPRWWEMVPEVIWPRTLLVSHGSGTWTENVFRGCERAGYLAGVSKVSLEPLPADQRDRATIIYNGVATSRARATIGREELRRTWGVPPDGKLVGFLGRFSGEKRPELLVDFLPHLAPSWYAVGWGYGPLGGAVRARADALGVGERVYLPGYVEDVGSMLHALDWLLVPSREEGGPYVLEEAWLARTPVICTPVGMALEWPELVRGIPLGCGGVQVAAALLADLADPEGTRRRTQAAAQFARRELSMRVFGRKWTELIEGVALALPTNTRKPGGQN